MDEAIQKAAADLANQRAGWVTRRDAAEALGRAAQAAVSTLQAHAEDADVDIRTAVAQALNGVALPEARALPGQTLDSLVRRCQAPGLREVTPEGEGFLVTVKLKGDRTQKVFVQPYTRKDGQELLRIFTWCGQGAEALYPRLLQLNAELTHCAFALLDSGAEDRVALVENLPRETATQEGVKDAVKEVAFYGDWIERKLSGSDEF